MTKSDFLTALGQTLYTSLPPQEIQKSLDYYAEIIDDRMEDGMSEEDAVSDLGTIEQVVEDILLDTNPPSSPAIRSRRQLKAWEIVVIVLGSPVWLPLILAGMVVVLALYLTAWALLLSLWAVAVSLAAAGVCSLIASVFTLTRYPLSSLFLLGIGLFGSGSAVLAGCGMWKLTRWFARWTVSRMCAMRNRFLQKGDMTHA